MCIYIYTYTVHIYICNHMYVYIYIYTHVYISSRLHIIHVKYMSTKSLSTVGLRIFSGNYRPGSQSTCRVRPPTRPRSLPPMSVASLAVRHRRAQSEKTIGSLSIEAARIERESRNHHKWWLLMDECGVILPIYKLWRWNIYLHLGHKKGVNVGKYTIHGAGGYINHSSNHIY